MGLFSTFPEDLKDLDTKLSGLAVHVAGLGSGNTPPGLVDELIVEISHDVERIRPRLLAEGRDKDLHRLRQRALRTGKFMDNRSYNKVFIPYIDKILPT